MEPVLKLVPSVKSAAPGAEASEGLINLSVGKRIRRRRRLMGMTQKELAAYLGVGFQQVQKYETSEGRLSAARLFLLAKALRVRVEYFFREMPGESEAANDARHQSWTPDGEARTEKEAEELLVNYTRLPESLRCSLRKFARNLSAVLAAPNESNLKQNQPSSGGASWP